MEIRESSVKGKVVTVEIERVNGDVCAVVYIAGERRLVSLHGASAWHKSGWDYTISEEGKGALGLSVADAEAVNSALQVARQPSPEQALRNARRALVVSYWALVEESDSAFAGRHDAEDETAWTHKIADDSRVDAARDAIAAFDTAHPEIVTQIRAEQAERSARYAAQD